MRKNVSHSILIVVVSRRASTERIQGSPFVQLQRLSFSLRLRSSARRGWKSGAGEIIWEMVER